jgi:hypothetical protein
MKLQWDRYVAKTKNMKIAQNFCEGNLGKHAGLVEKPRRA